MDASIVTEFLNHVGGVLIDEVFEDDGTSRGILYHYTGGDAVLGMLLKNRVWLTSVHSLNDPTEGHYGYTAFIEQWNAASGEKRESIDANLYNSYVNEFVFCLSSESDSLDQWRAYGMNGEGFCIGLKPKSHSDAILRKMTYGPDFAERTVEVVRRFMPRFRKKWKEMGLPQAQWDDIRVLSAAAAFVSSEVKHSCYASEKEWRLTLYENDPMEWRFRDGSVGITSYLDREFSDMFELRSICIGPKSRTSVPAIKRLVRQLGQQVSVDVRESKIPYR